jgi:hypothetical protein
MVERISAKKISDAATAKSKSGFDIFLRLHSFFGTKQGAVS